MMTDKCSARLGDNCRCRSALLLADLLHCANYAAGIILHSDFFVRTMRVIAARSKPHPGAYTVP